MSYAFESDGKMVSNRQLLLRGMGVLLLLAAVVAALVAKSEGAFQKTVAVTAALTNVGDGLPPKSDVKYLGVLVGFVDGVTPSTGGGPNLVRLDLIPHYAGEIPDTVTARVVPSNVFAVPSIQLVDNGPGAPLAAGAEIAEDHSLATVRLQTSLTALGRIAAAVGRPGDDPSLGLLTLLEQATSGRGGEALRAASQLRQLVDALNGALAPDGTVSTLSALSTAVTGLQASAPDLLDALHDAIVPLRAVAQQRQQLGELISGGLTTTTTVGTALQHNTTTILDITGKMGPTLRVLADGGRGFDQMATSQTRLSTTFNTRFWDFGTESATAKIILELTPHKLYTRADCPRYGNLAGPSCATAPIGPAVIGSDADAQDLAAIGGNVGSAGSKQEEDRLAALLGARPDAATDLLAGPLIRGVAAGGTGR